ncbi:MAG: hypothetical protein HN837_06180, partial [Chloroflexi bacterium]|nr:hypothetical protein [Chloroflexota bacterium]
MSKEVSRTVKFTLEEPYGTFLGTLESVFIVPKVIWQDIEGAEDSTVFADYVAPSGDQARRELLIGSGPFIFHEYVADQHYWVKATPYYRDGVAKMSDVVIYIYETPEVALAALKTGEVDALQMIETPTDVPELLAAGSINMDMITTYNHNAMLFMNMRYDPFKVLEVRQAISNAIDREALINFSQAGYANMPQNVSYAPGLPWSNPDVAWNDAGLDRDTLVAAANALLDDVEGISKTPAAVNVGTDEDPVMEIPDFVRTYDRGLGDGPQPMGYECIYIDSATYERAARITADNLMDIGIKVNPTPVEGSYLGRTLFSGWFIWDWEMSLFGYPSDPDFSSFFKQWSNNAALDTQAQWSLDGSKIAFVS